METKKISVCWLLGIVICVTAQNACEDKGDLFHWRNLGGFFIFRDILQLCTIRLLGVINDPEFNSEFASCVKAEGLPYSFNCRVCFAEVANCTDKLCIEECLISGSESQQCEDCAETKCDPVFEACAGTKMDLSSCPGCSEPLGTIFYFIYDEVTYAIAALLFVLIVLLLYKCVPRPKEDVEEAYPEDGSSITRRKKLSSNTSSNLRQHQQLQNNFARTVLPSALGSQWVKMDEEEEPFPDGSSLGLLEQRLPSVSSLGKSKGNQRQQSATSAHFNQQFSHIPRPIDFDQFTESPVLFDSRRNLPIDPMAATQITNAKDTDFDEIEGLKPPSKPATSKAPSESL